MTASQVVDVLTGREVQPAVKTIVLDIRLVKAVTAILAGIAVSVSGLIMQTLFQNPLAGPYVLGISSGASLGAAIYVLGASALGIAASGAAAQLGLAGFAWLGAAGVLMIIAAAGRRIKDIMIILILGMMLGSGIDAIVQIMQYLSDEASLKSYVMWTMGSLNSVSGWQLGFLGISVAAGIAIIVTSCKSLNLLLLGERYAVSMGLNLKKSRSLIFLATVLLAGTVTAFCGPLGFIGLAIPHITRFILKNADHRVLIPGTMLTGAVIMLGCDIVAKTVALPINAITSLIGIPVVIWVVVKQSKLY